VEADRQKRAKILLSEAQKQSDINIAEGKRQSKILESEASRMEKINIAQGEAEAQTINATAQAEALSKVGHELGQSESNKQAAAFNLGLKYMEAFSNIAKETNSVIIPSDINDGSKMLAQGMTLYKSLFGKNMLNQGEEPSSGGTNQNSISSNNSQKKKP
ncbi:MAG: Stomatin-like protein 2, mitochondrial, partial [Paramarteilia canceri]